MRNAEHRLGSFGKSVSHAEAVLGAPVLQRCQKGFNDVGWRQFCPAILFLRENQPLICLWFGNIFKNSVPDFAAIGNKSPHGQQ